MKSNLHLNFQFSFVYYVKAITRNEGDNKKNQGIDNTVSFFLFIKIIFTKY